MGQRSRVARLLPPDGSRGRSEQQYGQSLHQPQLEGKLQTKLNDPCRAGISNSTEHLTTICHTGTGPLSMVERVEQIRAELHPRPLIREPHGSDLAERKIPVVGAWEGYRSHGSIGPSTKGCIDKARGVEPLQPGLVEIFSRVTNTVWVAPGKRHPGQVSAVHRLGTSGRKVVMPLAVQPLTTLFMTGPTELASSFPRPKGKV